MSRRMNSNSRGRQSQTATTRGPQIKLTFGGKTGTKAGARKATTIPKNKPKKKRVPSFSEAESTTSGGESDGDYNLDADEESNEADDESDDPEVDAPSHFPHLCSEAGPIFIDQQGGESSDEDEDDGEWPGFPELPSLEGDLNAGTAFERALFDSDDDVLYERVNEVSDSDDEEDEEALLRKAESEILNTNLNDDLTSHFANQIDGMSAYGFGDNSDEEGSVFFPFSSGDEANEPHDRRVHFEEQPPVGVSSAFAMLGGSPTMTRPLLPSAFPDVNGQANEDQQDIEDSEDDSNDSDTTQELHDPKTAWQLASKRTPNRTEMSPPTTAATAKRTPGQKGPVRGTFEDNGDKTVAILDPTGKKLLLQDPHLLGGVFARKYGPSAPASPSNSFASAVFNESDSSQDLGSPQPGTAQTLPNIDLMLSGLTSGENAFMNGQAIGFPEAFLSSNQSYLNALVPDVFDDVEDPEKQIQLEDMVAFEPEGEDTIPNSPANDPFGCLPMSMSAPGTPLAHLNHMNVTAFKRKADPSFFGSPAYLPSSPIRNTFATPSKSKRKRSTRFDSPYNDAHYKGVTPVQRITLNEHENLQSSSPAPMSARIHSHKRRKTIL